MAAFRASADPPDGAPADAAFAGPPAVLIAPDEQSALLHLARTALGVALGLVPTEWLDEDLAATACTEPAAAFVTLTIAGALRGCIGTLAAEVPVCRSVVEAAYNAALRDPRFPALSAAELPVLHLEISVLGPPLALPAPADLRPGRDGLIVQKGRFRALMLPEVATEFGWNGQDLLEATCHKAGLPAGAWREPDTRMYVFRTAHFGGPALEDLESDSGSDLGLELV